jgi:hypothetical protein
VLVLEELIPETAEPVPGKWIDLLMLAITGGRERTKKEYSHLLSAAGFELEEVVRTSGSLSILVARPGSGTRHHPQDQMHLALLSIFPATLEVLELSAALVDETANRGCSACPETAESANVFRATHVFKEVAWKPALAINQSPRGCGVH